MVGLSIDLMRARLRSDVFYLFNIEGVTLEIVVYRVVLSLFLLVRSRPFWRCVKSLTDTIPRARGEQRSCIYPTEPDIIGE